MCLVARKWLREAKVVLVIAGAGLGEAAGLCETDPVGFATLNPELSVHLPRNTTTAALIAAIISQRKENQSQNQGKGVWAKTDKAQTSSILMSQLSAALTEFSSKPQKAALWAFVAGHAYRACHVLPVHNAYHLLLRAVTGKEYSVYTDLKDNQFARAGFDMSRVYRSCGDYEHLQCTNPRCHHIFDAEPLLSQMQLSLRDRLLGAAAQESSSDGGGIMATNNASAELAHLLSSVGYAHVLGLEDHHGSEAVQSWLAGLLPRCPQCTGQSVVFSIRPVMRADTVEAAGGANNEGERQKLKQPLAEKDDDDDDEEEEEEELRNGGNQNRWRDSEQGEDNAQQQQQLFFDNSRHARQRQGWKRLVSLQHTSAAGAGKEKTDPLYWCEAKEEERQGDEKEEDDDDQFEILDRLLGCEVRKATASSSSPSSSSSSSSSVVILELGTFNHSNNSDLHVLAERTRRRTGGRHICISDMGESDCTVSMQKVVIAGMDLLSVLEKIV